MVWKQLHLNNIHKLQKVLILMEKTNFFWHRRTTAVSKKNAKIEYVYDMFLHVKDYQIIVLYNASVVVIKPVMVM